MYMSDLQGTEGGASAVCTSESVSAVGDGRSHEETQRRKGSQITYRVHAGLNSSEGGGAYKGALRGEKGPAGIVLQARSRIE